MQEPLDQLRRYGEDLANAVPPARSRLAALRAVGGSPRPVRRLPRVAAATVGFFAIANVAAAAVSDSAVPGDALYPLDRAYEAVGSLIGLDHSAERLDEADVLIERSDLDGAMDLVVEAMPDSDLEGVTTALRGSATNEDVRTLVESARGLGEAMRTGDDEAVAEFRAALRLLDAQASDRDPEATPAEPATPADPGEPGQPATPATPADPGEPGQPAEPATPADPGEPGQPAEPATPADPGKDPGNQGNQGNQGDQGNQDQGQGSGGGRP
jgi:hypothetical protein